RRHFAGLYPVPLGLLVQRPVASRKGFVPMILQFMPLVGSHGNAAEGERYVARLAGLVKEKQIHGQTLSDPREARRLNSLMSCTLNLNCDRQSDWLIGLEFGRVDDGHPEDAIHPICDSFAYYLDKPEGRDVGFKALNLSAENLDSPTLAPIWDG